MPSAEWGKLIGMEAAAYRALFLHHLEIRGATLFRYDPPPSMQERISLTDLKRELIERANGMRRGTGVPFWEALIAT